MSKNDIDSRRAELSDGQREELERRLRGASGNATKEPVIPRCDRTAPIPLSHAQQSLWLTWRLDPASPAYNMAGALTIKGALDTVALKAALRALVQRHEILRTIYPSGQDGEPVQEILPTVPAVALCDVDLTAMTQDAMQLEARRLLGGFAAEPFSPESEAPFRAELYRLSDNEHILGLALHHIAGDGWSIGILINELFSLYEACKAGRPPALPPMTIQFADYAVWQRARFDTGERDRQIAYWRARLGAEHPPIALPFKQPRSAVADAREARHVFCLSHDLSDRLRELARSRGASLYVVMLSLLTLALYRFSGDRHVRVGAPIANRQRAETHGLIGYLLNLQVFPTQVAPAQSFKDHLEQVRLTVLDGQAHQDLPFDVLVDALQPERQAGVHPLFQVKCTQQEDMSQAIFVAGLEISAETLPNGRVHFDLSLDFTNGQEGIRGVLIYAEALFDPAFIHAFATDLEDLAEQVTRLPDRPIAALEPSAFASQTLGAVHAFDSVDVLQMWSRAAERNASAAAVRDDVNVLTYAQLAQRSDSLALALIEKGVGAEVRVGLHADRSCEFVVGVLAVLKAGGAYVPLDPALPADRLAYQLQHSGASLLLSKTQPAWDPFVPVIRLDLAQIAEPVGRSVLPTRVHRAQAAYVIYTSGSTGRPKGVIVSHGALANYVGAVLERLDLAEGARSMAMVSTIAADLGHTVLFGALCSGRTLHLISHERAFDPDAFAEYMSRHRVDVLKIVPSHLQALLSAGTPADVLPARRLVLGGETTQWPFLDRIEHLKPTCQVLNHYGPTETTVGVLTQESSHASRSAGTLPIGHPLANANACVLDADLNVVPAGVAGELYLGGAGVARGYQAHAAQTAERFIASPVEAGERLYRTGDRVKMLVDGGVEFLGRVDDQVKVRGYRVELSEVVHALRGQPDVKDAAVVARDDNEGRTQLHAYVVAQDGHRIDGVRLREALAQTLPDYMIPAAIMSLSALPLTFNGKVDRKALPELAQRAVKHYEAPEGDVERALADIWEQVLRADRIGRHDNFFELGGDSILTLQIVARARKRGLRFSPKDLMERQTIAAVAAVASLNAMAATATLPAATPPASIDAFAPTPAQAWFFEQEFEDAHHWNQSLLLSAIEAIEPAHVQQAIEWVVAHHDALRLRFDREADGRWSLTQQPAGQAVFERIDLSVERDLATAITTAADRVQQSLSLHRPFKAVWMDLGTGRAGRLLLVAHHLVVDGVSWRVILDDLQTVYRQLCEGRAPELSESTTSFRDWSSVLARYAQSAGLATEKQFWQSVIGRAEPSLPGIVDGSNTVADARTVSTSLDESLTEQLLGDVPQAYRTRIDEVLLTALARTLCAWDGRDSVLVELEGHGREAQLFDGTDLSRTVGWFTTLYPVRLAPSDIQRDDRSVSNSLKAIKEQVRQVPHKGLGYGVLRYLGTTGHALADGAYPQVTFNYLGQLDQSFGVDSMWRLAREHAGQERAPGSRRRTWLSVDADVHRGELRVRWTYSTAIHCAATVQGLAQRFMDELQGLIAHCLSGARGVTPADFPLAHLSQHQLDHLPLIWERLTDLYPLAPMQTGMLFHSMLEPDGTAYVNQLRLDLEGLDVSRFKAAWQTLLDHHDVLRTGFVQGETPLQWVARSVNLPLVELDWRHRTELSVALDALAQAELMQGFDLSAPPLMRLVLVQSAENRHHFVWTRHHLLLDGWSSARLMAELLARHAGHNPSPPRGRYRDYIGWLQTRDNVAAEHYWRTLLHGLEEPCRLTPAVKKSASRQGGLERLQVFDAAETAHMADFVRAQRVTLNTLVQAGWALLLQRYTGEARVSFGATTSGRPSDLLGADEVLGLFINTLPVVSQGRPGQQIGDWLRELQAQNIASREYEHTPLVEIQRWAGVPGRDLFDSILVFENYPVDAALGHPTAALRVLVSANREETTYPITVTVQPGETLTIGFAFLAGVSVEWVDRLIKHFAAVLRALTRSAQRKLADVELLDDNERSQLREWGVNAHRYPTVEPIHRLIECQVHKSPKAVALLFGEERLTYRELNARANRLAHRLIALGVGREAKVGIAVERSIEMVVGLLAILKAGGAYVPLDPEYPADRLAYMVKDSGVDLLLTQSQIAASWPASGRLGVLELDTLDLNAEPECNPQATVHEENLAYVIYTSGSTGRPKGVGIPHRCLAEHAQVSVDFFGLTAADRMLQFATLNFDGCIEQLFAPLLVGATIVLRGPALWDSTTFYRELIAKQISVVDLTTAYWLLLVHDFVRQGVRHYGALRQVHVGGEAMPPEGLKAWREAGLGDIKLLNTYGPTEATVTASVLDCGPYVSEDITLPTLMPIGSPLAGRALRVLDADLGLAPQGVVGELCIGGDVLARGYLGRAGLSAERFVADPVDEAGNRLYRTGDLVRWNEQGQLEYLGRIDHQVKIRGLRIETGEIEAELLAQPEVREAVVVAKGAPGGVRLVAYVAAKVGQIVEIESLRERLGKHLPDYMMPSAIVVLDKLPQNTSGKIDRKALPAIVPQSAGTGVAPIGMWEEKLAKIWAELLGVDGVDRNSHFFGVGGDSLKALMLLSRIRSTLTVDMPLRTVFKQPTLRAMAAELEQLAEARGSAVADQSQSEGCKKYQHLSAAQQRLWVVDRLARGADRPGDAAYNMAAVLRIKGPLDHASLKAAIELIVMRHQVLRTCYPEDDDGEPLTVVADGPDFEWITLDVSSIPYGERPDSFESIFADLSGRPFDLACGPLLRTALIKLEKHDHYFMTCVHHIVFDGWSEAIFINEFSAAYEAIRAGVDPKLEDLRASYSDYAASHRNRLTLSARQDSLFWKSYLEGAPKLSTFAPDLDHAVDPMHLGASIDHLIPDMVADNLRQLAQENDATLFHALIAGFTAFLHDEIGTSDMVVGTDVAGRDALEYEALIGFFVNVVPLRFILTGPTTFGEWLAQVRANCLAAMEYRHVPFDHIVEYSKAPRIKGRNPLVQILFVLQNAPQQTLTVTGLDIEVVPVATRNSKFDIAVFVSERSDGLQVKWVYSRALYRPETIERLSTSWKDFLLRVSAGARVSLVSLFSHLTKEPKMTTPLLSQSAKLDKLERFARGGDAAPLNAPSLVRTSFLPSGQEFPLVIQPISTDLDAVAWAEGNREFIEASLRKHACLLFRGFGLETPQDFEAFAEAMQPGLYGGYGDLPKKQGGRNTYRSTPYPERQMILYHNESAHLDRWPRKQWFFCELPSKVGGATPIVDCREMLRRLPAETVADFEQKGILYVRTFVPRLDVSWQDFFKTQSRDEVEARLASAGVEWQWLDENTLQTRTRCPAVISHPLTGERVFFNQVQLHHVSCLEANVRDDLLALVGAERMTRQAFYGDGSPISDDTMDIVGRTYEACAVRFKWLPGDVVMLDNMLAAHARDPYEEPRKIVVAMGDMIDKNTLARFRPSTSSGE